MAARAVIFDFNGTLSHDEPILLAVYQELFAEHGRPLSAGEYYGELAGLSDLEIVQAWLGADYPATDELIERRIDRYRELAVDGSTITEAVREAVRYAAERVPVAIVSGAARAEIEQVLEAAELAGFFPFIVAAEDVLHGKPAPDGYLRALELLGGGLAGADVRRVRGHRGRGRRRRSRRRCAASPCSGRFRPSGWPRPTRSFPRSTPR